MRCSPQIPNEMVDAGPSRGNPRDSLGKTGAILIWIRRTAITEVVGEAMLLVTAEGPNSPEHSGIT